MANSLLDAITSPLTGDYRKEKPLSVKAADTAVSLTTPIDSIVEIQEELKKDKPDYLKIGMLGGVEAISLIPGIAPAARTMIRKGADMARQTEEAIEVASNVPKVTKTKPEEFSGTIKVQHGYQGDAPKEFLPRGQYEGFRYDTDGGNFGDKPLYLEDPDNPFFLNEDRVVEFVKDGVVDVDASFDRAFVLTPETVGKLKEKVGDVDLLDETSGPLVVDKLEELGYDGLIIRGFPHPYDTELTAIQKEMDQALRGLKNTPEDFARGQEIVESYQSRMRAAEEKAGIVEDMQQPQILAFRPERQKVKSDTDVKPQMSNEEYDSLFLSLDEADNPKEWQQGAKALIKKGRVADPSIKTPELENSTRLLLDNKITREEHLANVDKYKPVNPWDALPREPSDKALVFALTTNKRTDGLFVLDDITTEALGVSKSPLSVGMRFNGRLDIPAYNYHDTWIVAGTSPAVKTADNKGVTNYAKAIHYVADGDKPVKFVASPKTSESIGTGEADKIGYATVSGIVGDLDVDAIRAKAAQYLNDPEWTQVGFDPRRQGGFYVRAGENKHVPVREADEVIQIGPLVLAKNAKLDKDYAGYAEGGVAMDEQMNAVFKTSRTGYALGGDVEVDPVSGNEVPPGSLPEEVRDDIPAMLSEGEYVVPADVLRFYGVKFFEDLRAQAKMGLAEMEANGRIGGEPIEEETGDVGISDEDLMVIMAQAPQEEPQQVMANRGGLMGFQAGGLNFPEYIKQPDLTQFGMAGPDFQGGLEYRTYVNDAGMEITIPFFDGEPMGMIPPGYSLKGEVAQQEEAPQASQDDDEPVRVQTPAREEFDLDAIPTEELEKTARGLSAMNSIATGIASAAGLPVAALVNTAGVARYNDVLDRLQAEDPEAFEKSGLEKKGSIFGGESSLYENLKDRSDEQEGNKPGVDFGDTWLGDFLGFDGEAGVQGPGLRDSIGGARRTGDDDDNNTPPAPTATSTPSETPEPENNTEPSGSSVQAAADSYSDLAEAEDEDYGLLNKGGMMQKKKKK